MSTSPSWFDKEKFSRLVKKVGTTTRSGGSPSATPVTAPVSSPSVPKETAPASQTQPATPPAIEVPLPAPAAEEPPARATNSTIPKPSASVSLFSYKKSPPAAVSASPTTPAPTADLPEPVFDDTSDFTPAVPPAPVPRVFIAPAEVSAPLPEAEPEKKGKPKFTFEFPKAEPEAREEEKPKFSFEFPKPKPESRQEEKPKFSFEIPKSEIATKPLPPEPAAGKVELAADFHVAEPTHVIKKSSQTSTLQRLPQIGPEGAKPAAPPTASSTLLRRTTAIPGVKPLTAPLEPVDRTEAPIRAGEEPASFPTPPAGVLVSKTPTSKIVEFPKEAQAAPADEFPSHKEEIAQLNQERDDAYLEIENLRSQLEATQQENLAALQTKEVIMVTSERDAARRDYAELRQQYEKIKQEQHRFKNEYAASIADLRKQLEAASRQGGAYEQELAAGKDDFIETLKQELKSLQEQVARAKEEASTAQRGLALSQKALQETRDALREVSDVKGTIETFKKERATLLQEKMLLQAQNDKMVRELSDLKAKPLK